MLRVLLVDEAPDRAAALKEALAFAGAGSVACTLDSPLELLRRVEEHAPDVVLIATESPSRDVLEQLAVVSGKAPRPVVVFSDDGEGAAIRAALRAGVSAYVVDGIAPHRLETIMTVAIERFESEQRLRAELEDAKARLAERKVIERAKGILMKQRGASEEEAFALLRSLAMQRGIRLGDAAQQVIDVAAMLG